MNFNYLNITAESHRYNFEQRITTEKHTNIQYDFI